MPYSVKILLDSIGPNDKRIVTWELSYPRFVHAELMTHRVFSRNAASSRAIPISKMIEKIKTDPVFPVWFGKNQTGMQAREELERDGIELVKKTWLEARDLIVEKVEQLQKLNLHKQISNRLLEPFMFITIILTATEYDNWFKLRCHPDAQPEIKWVADEMKRQYDSHVPQKLNVGEWHIPMLLDEEKKLSDTQKLEIATARCARVSYLTHEGKKDYSQDKTLHDSLSKNGHWSPFEHCAQALDSVTCNSNFVGWTQYRKMFPQENGL